MDEQVLKPCLRRSVLHEYGEPLKASVLVYALEEIVAEKLRSILQQVKALKERGWSRSRARDYYDLWRILGTYKDRLDLADFSAFLRQKCSLRQVTFTGPDSFFPEVLLPLIEKDWNGGLGPLVAGLPQFQMVLSELRPQVASLLAGR